MFSSNLWSESSPTHTHSPLSTHSGKQRFSNVSNPKIWVKDFQNTRTHKKKQAWASDTHTYRTHRGYFHISPSSFLATPAVLPESSPFGYKCVPSSICSSSTIAGLLPLELHQPSWCHSTRFSLVPIWVALQVRSGKYIFISVPAQVLIWVPC